MAKLIEAYGAEDKCDVMVVKKGLDGGPGNLYRAVKITEEKVILEFWYETTESKWVAFPPKGRWPFPPPVEKGVIRREDVLCAVESVEEWQELQREWWECRKEIMSLLEKRKAEIDPIEARYQAKSDELKKSHADRLNCLLGVKVF